jgi:hypothetical protein
MQIRRPLSSHFNRKIISPLSNRYKSQLRRPFASQYNRQVWKPIYSHYALSLAIIIGW